LVAAVLWFSLPSADDPDAINSGAMNFMFIIMYLLLAIAVVTALFFGLSKLFTTPGSIKKALFALGGLAIVVAISYGLSSNNMAVVETMSQRGIETTEGTVKNIGMGLNVFFILTAVAVVLMIFPGLKRMFVK
jgi:glucan phosphoethanolaminetransferase (alkaline phosphatase superfamily)